VRDVYTYDALAWALYENHKYEEAHAAAVEALRLGTPEAMFHYHADMIAAALHRNEEAASHPAKALGLNPRLTHGRRRLRQRRCTTCNRGRARQCSRSKAGRAET
jgi:tetratricopeptide (TPR) repeat protein